ncbi:hypothetical protein, partial [Enterococcus faecalis]|uniref:hypothetical protein n=1 Tax=Enterococcus faecalis TaxID=1351 RepID=UPI003D6C1AB2
LGQDQETGVTDGPSQPRTLEDEVDNWDEHAADDWDDDDAAPKTPASPATTKGNEPEPSGPAESKKRTE